MVALPISEPRARLDLESRHQSRVGDRAENAVALRQRVGECACGSSTVWPNSG